jgi:hypothetical protein
MADNHSADEALKRDRRGLRRIAERAAKGLWPGTAQSQNAGIIEEAMSAAYRAAWEAKEAADVAAVENERLEHEEGDQCFVDDCSDCAYQRALSDAVGAIKRR